MSADARIGIGLLSLIVILCSIGLAIPLHAIAYELRKLREMWASEPKEEQP